MSWLDSLPRCPVSGKFRHPSAKSVLKQAAMLEAKGKPVGPRCRPYRCPSCHDWHLGHDSRLLKADIAKALAAGSAKAKAARRPRRR